MTEKYTRKQLESMSAEQLSNVASRISVTPTQQKTFTLSNGDTIEVISSDRTTDSKANGNFLKKIPSSPVLIVNSTPETDLNLNTDSRT